MKEMEKKRKPKMLDVGSLPYETYRNLAVLNNSVERRSVISSLEKEIVHKEDVSFPEI